MMTDEKQIQKLFDQDSSISKPPDSLVDDAVTVSRRRIAAMDLLHFGIGPLFAVLLQLLAPLVGMLAPVAAKNVTSGKKP